MGGLFRYNTNPTVAAPAWNGMPSSFPFVLGIGSSVSIAGNVTSTLPLTLTTVGNWPSWLSVSSVNRTITATAASVLGTTLNLAVLATDTTPLSTQSPLFSVVVAIGTNPPVWNSTTFVTLRQGDTINLNTLCTDQDVGDSLTFSTLLTLPIGVTLNQSSGVLTVGATVAIAAYSLRFRATDTTNRIADSQLLTLSVIAAALGAVQITIGTIASIQFQPGVANQSVDLAAYVSESGGGLPPLFYSTWSGAMAGVSLQGSVLVYDPSVLSGNTDQVLKVTDQTLSVPTQDVSLFAINDSTVDGANAGFSHPLLKLPWRNTAFTYPQALYQYTHNVVGTGYGDCIGTDSLAYPTSQSYFARVFQLVLASAQTLTIPATSIVNFWIAANPNWGMTLIGSAGAITNFSGRTDAIVNNRPTLSITRSDGSQVTVPCSAHRSLTAPSGATSGANIDCTAGAGSMLLYFDLTAILGLTLPCLSATLSLFGITRGATNTISIYATDMSYVLRAQAPVQGLAAASIKDAGLVASFAADLAIAGGVSPPSRPAGGVIYAETWPDLTNMAARGYYQRSSSGSPIPATASLIGATDVENPGYAPLASGVNCMKLKMNAGMAVAMNVIWPFHGPWGYNPDHIWVRFYLMLANDWPFYDTVSGVGNTSRGKFPFAPACHVPTGKGNSLIGKHAANANPVSWSLNGVIPDGGNGGVPATGACMWSMRNYWYSLGNTTGGVPTAAVHGPLAVAGYWPISSEDMYSAEQWNAFGDDNFWLSQRTTAGMLKRNTWHCIELHVKMNTLWTASSAGPDPVYLGDVRRMPYRSGTVDGSNPLINDQLGHDTSITTFNRYIYYGNATGLRYVGLTTPIAPDTVVLRSDTQYGTASMIGVKDGIYEAYVDGVLAHSRTDMRWRHIPDAGIDCLWFDYGQTQLVAGSTGSVYFSQGMAVDGDIVAGPIGPMRLA